MLSIFAMQLIMKGVQEVQQVMIGVLYKPQSINTIQKAKRNNA